MTDVILLTFDLEEFDIPDEFGRKTENDQQFNVTESGLIPLLERLDHLNVTATFFTTAWYAVNRPASIAAVTRRHELASHAYYHSRFEIEHLLRSRRTLEQIGRSPVRGFRRPRFAHTDTRHVEAAGYHYNSSINPTCLPGRYNYLGRSRLAHLDGRLVNIPLSVTPLLRLPLFWLTFKNLLPPIYRKMAAWTLKHDGVLNLVFHPWEFAELGEWPLPNYIRKPDGSHLLERFESLIQWLKHRGEFITCSEYEAILRNQVANR